MVAEKLAYHE